MPQNRPGLDFDIFWQAGTGFWQPVPSWNNPGQPHDRREKRVVVFSRNRGVLLLFLSWDKGTAGQGNFFVPGERDKETVLSRNKVTMGCPVSDCPGTARPLETLNLTEWGNLLSDSWQICFKIVHMFYFQVWFLAWWFSFHWRAFRWVSTVDAWCCNPVKR